MVRLYGWIYKKRVFGKKVFVDLRAINNKGYLGKIIQLVFDSSRLSSDVFKLIKKLGQESFLDVEGEFVENPRAPGGKELYVSKILRYYESESPYPLAKKSHSPDFLLDVRHLVVRSPRYQKIWLMREALTDYIKEWFKKNGWVEVYPPILVFTAVEGGATLFALDYFGLEGYLSQSAQLYLEVMIYSLGKVFSLTPSFRAEKSRTRRHLAEFWHFEAEAALHKFDDILKVEEESLTYAIRRILDNDSYVEWLKEFRGDIETIENIRAPFPRITYDEALEILRGKGVNLKWGDDFGADEEKILSEEFETPFFVVMYPTKIKAFYVKADENDPKKCYSADLMAPEGYGEITTGGEREDNIEALVERIRREGFDPESYRWYLDIRRYGSVPHSGYGLGIERALMWLLKLDHVREVIPFPRLTRRKMLI